MTSGSGQDGVDAPLPIFPLSTAKNARYDVYNKHNKTLKGGDKKTDWLGT